MSIGRTSCALVVAALLAACSPKPAQQTAASAVDSVAVQAAVADFWQRWVTADTAGNIAGMGDLVADSIRIDSKGAPPIMGKAAWQTFADSMLKGAKVLTEIITADMTIPISNELAYQNGNYVETTMIGNKKSTDYGRYAGAIEKGADGKWRLRYIMAFSDSSAAAK